MKKKHGWVLQEKGSGKVVTDSLNASKTLRKAQVFTTRSRARIVTAGYRVGDVVRKVKVNKNYKAVKFIPGR